MQEDPTNCAAGCCAVLPQGLEGSGVTHSTHHGPEVGVHTGQQLLPAPAGVQRGLGRWEDERGRDRGDRGDRRAG
jgi:hypothetical protein